MRSGSTQHSAIGLKILARFLNAQKHYGLYGDLEEMYHLKADQDPLKAEFWLLVQVLKCFPAAFINFLFWSYIMWKNYVKVAFRNLIKDKVPSIINIVGLSTTIGVAIVSFLFYDFFYNRDTFHVNGENIYVIENVISSDGTDQLWGNSPMPLGPALKADFPQIERIVRINSGSGVMRFGDRVFTERVRFVDAGFLDMFTFPLKYGTREALRSETQIILNDKTADKYFGDTNPVGEQVTITFNDVQKETFFIGGVTEELPDNASFGFSILMSFEKLRDLGLTDFTNWSDLITATFIQLQDGTNAGVIQSQLQPYIELQNNADVNRPMKSFVLDPLFKMAQNSHKIKNDIVFITLYPGQLMSSFFSGISLLFLACFNFMNISMGSASRRLKEIGIRKVIGSRRIQLVFQFLSENLLLCFVALVIGVLLGQFFFAPGFNELFGVFNLKVDIIGNSRLLLFLASLLVITGIGSGLYPALHISAFQPVTIFRGKEKFQKKNILMKILLTIQFIFSFLCVAYSIVFIQNNKYQQNRDWGYNQTQVLTIPVESETQFTQLKNRIQQNADIIQVGGAMHHFGHSPRPTGIDVLETKYEVMQFGIGYDYMDVMGVRLKQGRFFSRNMQNDIHQSIVVNSTFVNTMKWQEPVGQRILIEDQPYYVVGVTEDFHFRSFMKKVDPAFMRLVPEEWFRYLVATVQPGTTIRTMDYIRSTWQALFPDSPFEGFFQDDVFTGYREAMLGVARMSTVTALIAVIVTCMGIFGLVTMNITKRMKEISIRKVLGASTANVTRLINKGFIILLIIAGVIGLPSAFFAVKVILDAIWEYHVALNPMPFLTAMGIILFSAALTISLQVYKAAVSNPVDMLRDE